MITDPVDYWQLDEGAGTSASDIAGGQTGTLGSGASWIAGEIGSGAVRFDKTSNGHISFPQIDLGTIYTVAFWVWVRDPSSSADGVVVGGPSTHYALYFDSTTLYHSAGASNFVSVNHGGLASLRSWNHVVVTRNGPTVQFYLNGTALGVFQTLSTPTNTLRLDTMGSYNGFNFASQTDVDDVRFYNHVFTSTDASDLFAFTSGVDSRSATSSIKGLTLAVSTGLKSSTSSSLSKARSNQSASGSKIASSSSIAKIKASQTSVGTKSATSSSQARSRSSQTSIDTKVASNSSLSSARGIVLSTGSQAGVDTRSSNSGAVARGLIVSTGFKSSSGTSLARVKGVIVSGGTRAVSSASSVRAKGLATAAGFKRSSAFSSVRALSLGTSQTQKFAGAISIVRARGVVISLRDGEIITPYVTPVETPGSPRLDQITTFTNPPRIGRVT